MGILDFVFPKTCLECGRGGRYLCQGCIDRTQRAGVICPYCKHPSIDGVTHINCQKKLGIDGITSIWEYDGVIRKAILTLKYKYATEISRELSDHLSSSLKTVVMPSVYYLTPIPIYWYRQNTRGFNQSIEVGERISYMMKWKFIPNLLIKNKQTISQVELSGEKRRKNLHGSFSINKNIDMPESLFLFDDVFTTGSTMFEAAKVLKRSGVQQVWGLTIAR